jgi:ribonuclease BN (tRNA processing enzyme)
VAFSGDTSWTSRLPELSHGADLFVCECFGFDGAPPGHLDYRTIRDGREALACRRLILTHMSDSMLSRLDGLDVETAADGMALSL